MISIVLDTETTGLPLPSSAPLEKQPKIIELALSKLQDGVILEKMSWLINPEQPITAEITKITGLKDEDLVGQPNFEATLPWIVSAFEGVDVLIAHNLPFDRGMLQFDLRRCNKLEDFPWPLQEFCTVQEFRHLFGYRPKLTQLYEKIVGRPLAQTHRAMDDVDALVEILLETKMV